MRRFLHTFLIIKDENTTTTTTQMTYGMCRYCPRRDRILYIMIHFLVSEWAGAIIKSLHILRRQMISRARDRLTARPPAPARIRIARLKLVVVDR